MTKKMPEEVIKIHEKSLMLLDKSNEQLKNVQEMLRKAVVRLSIAARRDDEQLNELLEQIKSSVKNDVDLEQLGAHLDDLFVFMNHADNENKLSSGRRFYSYLKQSINDFNIFSAIDEPYKTKILDLANSKLPDDVISIQLLTLIKDIVTETSNGESGPNNEFKNVELFAKDISESLGLYFEVKEDITVSTILDELANNIENHIDKIKDSKLEVPEQTVSVSDNPAENLNELLSEFVNNLVLPTNIQIEHHAVFRGLEGPTNEAGQWKLVVADISAQINKSFEIIRVEKEELQVFIRKITAQLEEIEKYVRKSRQDRIDTVSESSILKDSVDANVDRIKITVSDAAEINQLKNDVQVHLTEIRKSVEEHQQAEVEREDISKQGYAHIIGELARTQKETLMLKEQLHESKQKMLRDPLTGLPNRMAYEERISLEINRSKRNKENICIAMWDLDHFKKINDTYGHEAGDRVLKLLAKIIILRVRKVDMFARIGGEEFVLLMPDTSLENALNLNDQLRNSLANSEFHYDGSPCPITASVGIAKIEEYDNSESVIRKADEALYKSKREGRNRCTIYTPDV